MGVNEIMNRKTGYQEIIYKLERKNKREYALLASAGAVITLLLSIGAFFTFSVFESLFNYASSVRTILFFLFILITLSSFGFLFILPLLKYFKFFRKTDYYRTAAEVGHYYPVIKDDLLNAMQLVSSDKNNYYYSPVLIDAAFSKVYEKSKGMHFEEMVDYGRLKRLLLYASAAVIFMLSLLVFVPGLQASSYRLYNFQREFIPPAEFSLTVYPGNADITKGDNLLITVIAKGKIPGEVIIAVKTDEQAEYIMERVLSDSSGKFDFTIPSVRTSLSYYASAGDIKSDEYRIEVTDKPLIKNFEVTVTPPAYSGLPEIVQQDNGNITTLMGSTVKLRLSSNKELKNAEIRLSDSLSNTMEVNYSSASGRFRVMGDYTYKIILTDLAENNNESPVTYSIKSLNDSYPAIEITEPGQDVDIGIDNRIGLGVKISDDFGFSRLVLNYRLSASRYGEPDQEYTSVNIPIGQNSREAEVNHIWNLSSMSLGTEDIVTYYLEVFDNDRVSGPKSSKTSTYNIRIPSLEEVLASADKKHNQVTDELQKTMKEAEDLKKTLEKIDDELKQDKKELTWQEKEKLENALDKFEQMQDKMKNTGEDMNQLQEDLQKNNLLSKETLEKYMELQKLFEELSGEEFKKAMEQMRDMLEKMDRKSAQDALENMKINEEAFKKSIERTLNLLKRVRIEQKMDDLVKRAEEINRNLDELMKENEGNQNMQKKQERMSEQLSDMKKEMDKLADEMEGVKDMPKEDMEKIAEEFDKQKNEQLSDEAAKNMQQNKMQQAKQNQSQLSQNIKNFSQQMQQMQQQMMQQNQMQTFSDMMKILENIITLSKQQEELKNESGMMDDITSSNKNAEKQANLQRSLDNLLKQMGDLSQKTFAITPEMGKALGDARREMMKSLQAMKSRNGSLSSNSQGDAMKSLNEAASMMQSSMEAMMQGGGQGGMMSLMQQLGQMGQQQMGLNNLTQKLQQGNQGKLTPSEQAELRRIQQQQDLIKKSLQELNREAKQTGESKKIPENLENIVKQMEEVISDMNTERLDDKLIQKQERILSRLLDAQKSLNERDFEKKRESNTGKNIVRESPKELNLSSDKGKDRIKYELNRAVNEGYKKDYEDLIRKYFEELQKENPEQKPSR